jgi:hypothetical protein
MQKNPESEIKIQRNITSRSTMTRPPGLSRIFTTVSYGTFQNMDSVLLETFRIYRLYRSSRLTLRKELSKNNFPVSCA